MLSKVRAPHCTTAQGTAANNAPWIRGFSYEVSTTITPYLTYPAICVQSVSPGSFYSYNTCDGDPNAPVQTLTAGAWTTNTFVYTNVAYSLAPVIQINWHAEDLLVTTTSVSTTSSSTTTGVTSSTTVPGSLSPGLSGGTIAGVVVAIVVALIIIAGAVFFFVRKRRKRARKNGRISSWAKAELEGTLGTAAHRGAGPFGKPEMEDTDRRAYEVEGGMRAPAELDGREIPAEADGRRHQEGSEAG